jgi:hypothetical protein
MARSTVRILSGLGVGSRWCGSANWAIVVVCLPTSLPRAQLQHAERKHTIITPANKFAITHERDWCSTMVQWPVAGPLQWSEGSKHPPAMVWL